MPKNDDKKMSDEPSWLDPSNDRKTPYTEDELEVFVNGYIKSNKKSWTTLVLEVGEAKAREIIKEGFRKQDERNVENMDIKGPLH